MNTPILSIQNLTKIYPPKDKGLPPFIAVDGISFSLKSGEILGLLGPNGAGKTTTIQMLLSTLKPTAGTITMLGKDFFKHRSELLQQVGFASTYSNLPDNLTVHENLVVHGHLCGLSGQELKKRIEKFLKVFDVYDQRNKEARSLSAGQKTRVLLAKAFMTHPAIVLLDEPTAALDPDICVEVRKFIRQQQQEYKTSILLTSHNMDEVAEVCDRILVLKNGRIIADNTPEALASSVSMARVGLMVGDGLKRTIAYAAQAGLRCDVQDRSITVYVKEHAISDFLMGIAKVGVVYSQIWIEKPSLEDYFLQIAKRNKESI
jgi:ABC-2 type transport system ATP-binding protein